MADAAKTPGRGDSLKTLEGLAIVLIVVLAVFMVTSLNQLNTELVKMNQQVETLINVAAQNSVGAYQAVDEDGNAQFRFTAVPVAAVGLGQSPCAAGGGTCGGTCQEGSAAGTCAAPAAPAK